MGKTAVNGVRRCDCKWLRRVPASALWGKRTEYGLGERVTKIKTKFWIGEEEQNDLFQAAEVLMKLLDDQKLLSDSSLKTACAVAPTKK